MEKLSKNGEKMIRSLHTKKGRDKHGLYIIEGYKPLLELQAQNQTIHTVVFDNSKISKYHDICKKLKIKPYFSENFAKISTLKNSEGCLTVLKIPKELSYPEFFKNNNKILVLDRISDPGNLGTIIRTAVWFGISGIILLKDSVNYLSPKVTRATMGAIFNIDLIYGDEQIFDYLEDYYKISTYLNRKHNYQQRDSDKIALFMGSEADGLNWKYQNKFDANFVIKGSGKIESLNLSIASAILMNNIFGSLL